MFVQFDNLGNLNRGRARFQPIVNSEVGSADEVYELFKSWYGRVETGDLSREYSPQLKKRTEDFPLPVAPMTLLNGRQIVADL